MNTFSKKIASIALTATTVVWASGALLFVPVPVANAQTAAQLQATIQALMTQIQQITAQLNAMPGGPASASYSYTRDLTVGSKGADVTALQQMLINKGYLTAVSAPTAYFGALTKAAVAAWQSAVGLTPPAGYFGPKSRAYVASLSVGTPPGVTPPGVTPPSITAPATGLAVALSPYNPPTGSLISGSARNLVLGVSLTAGTSGPATVTEIKFHKTGVLSDSSISGAYLVEGGKVLYQYSSVSGGVIDFAGLSLVVNAGQTRYVGLSIDPSAGLTAGNTVYFSLNSANDINSVDLSSNPIAETGPFPLSGNVFNVASVSNPSIASMAIASSSVGTSVYAGTTGNLISAWTVTASNSPVNLTSIKFSVVGSANKTDIRNLVLKINGTQIGSTLASVGADGTAYFDLTATPVKLNTGASSMQIYADVMGSPSFNFDFGLLNSFDVYGVDTQYGVPVAVTVTGGGTGTTSGHLVTIQQGQITVSVDTGTPTSNLALGGSGSSLAKFDFYAAGEAVKVKYLTFKLTFAGSGGTYPVNGATSTNLQYNIRNVYLTDDTGTQVGSTINTPPTTNACDNGTVGLAAGVYTDCFGTPASPINYIIPANTTRVLTLKADIQSTAGFTSITAGLSGQAGYNLQGLTSSQTANSGAATGSALTLSSTPLVASKNGAFGDQTYARGANIVKVGSYVLTASSAEGENVSNFTITLVPSSSTIFSNLLAKIGSTQIGSSFPTISAGNYTFSGNVPVPAGGTAIVDVYASAGTNIVGALGTLTKFASCSATGATTYTSISCTPTAGVNGQAITLSTGPTLAISNNNSLASRQVVMGASQVSLGKILLADTAGIEPIRIQEFKFNLATGASVGAAFGNLQLYDANGNAISGAGPISMTSGAPSFVADFNFGTAASLVIPQGGTLGFELRGNVSPWQVGSNIENATSVVSVVATSSVVAYGQSSNSSVTVSGTPTFTTLTSVRSKLLLSGVALGTDSTCGSYSLANATVNRGRTSVDYIACLHLSADPSGQEVHVNTLTLTFAGAAVTSSFNVQLIDPQTAANYDGTVATTTANCVTVGASCSVSFAFAGTPISAGATKGVVVEVNSSAFANVQQQYDGMDLTLSALGNVLYYDGGTGLSGVTNSAPGLSLSSDVAIPVLLTHIDYQ